MNAGLTREVPVAMSVALAVATLTLGLLVAVGRLGGTGSAVATDGTCAERRAALGLGGDGPCVILDLDPGTAEIQSTRSVASGASFSVDIIIENPPAPVGPLQFSVLYDDTVILAPEVADAGQGLDDNPDINQAALGGVDCSGFGLAYPKGDADAATGADHGAATISCVNLVGPYNLTSTGVAATVDFDVVASSGTTTITLNRFEGGAGFGALVGNDMGAEMGSCGPVNVTQMPCTSGTVNVGPSARLPEATVTPTPTTAPITAPFGPAGAPVAYQQRCSTAQSGKMEVVFLWPPSGAGHQWLDLSLFNNGFTPGTLVAIGPLPRGRWAFVWDGLLPGRTHYLRVNILTQAGWMPSETLKFATAVCGGPAVLSDVGQVCGRESGTVDVTFRWMPSIPNGPADPGLVQWLDLSLYDNDFAPGTFLGAGPLGRAASSFPWIGLRSGLVHYWRVNTLTPEGWKPSSTGSFVTGTCG